MAKTIADQNNFTAGEVDEKMLGRIETELYRKAAASLLNYVVLPTGGVTRRPGTQYICEVTGLPAPPEGGAGGGTGGGTTAPTEKRVFTFELDTTAEGINLFNKYGLGKVPPEGYLPDTFIFNIKAGAVIGAVSANTYALETGVFLPGTKLTINIGVGACISGAGGTGGMGQTGEAFTDGLPGGPALKVDFPVNISNLGTIQSGGRGGRGGSGKSSYGGGCGGGGAGSTPGEGGARANCNSGKVATLNTGGAGGVGKSRYVPPVYQGGGAWTSPSLVTPGYYVTESAAGESGGLPGSSAAIVAGNTQITWLKRGAINGEII